MPEPEVYEPSGELNNLLAEHATIVRETKIQEKVHRPMGRVYEVDDLPEEIDGIKVERPVEAERTLKSFLRSQIGDPDFYRAHKAEILEAQRHNLIVDDKTSREHAESQKRQREEAEGALRKADERIVLPYLVKEAKKATDEAWKEFEAAEAEHNSWMARNGVMADPRLAMVAFAPVKEKREAYDAANTKFNELTKKLTDMRLGRTPQEA